jgi:hypothetical protein
MNLELFKSKLNELAMESLNIKDKPNFTNRDFMNAVLVFHIVFADKINDLQIKEGMSIDTAIQMAEKSGEEIWSLIKTYTDIDIRDEKQIYE